MISPALCALRGGTSSAKRQIRTKPATDSITESAPNPTSAIELAAIPAPIAIAASIACQPIPPRRAILLGPPTFPAHAQENGPRAGVPWTPR